MEELTSLVGGRRTSYAMRGFIHTFIHSYIHPYTSKTFFITVTQTIVSEQGKSPSGDILNALITYTPEINKIRGDRKTSLLVPVSSSFLQIKVLWWSQKTTLCLCRTITGHRVKNLSYVCGRMCFRLRSCLSTSISEHLPHTPATWEGCIRKGYLQKQIFSTRVQNPEKKKVWKRGKTWGRWLGHVCVPHLGGNKAVPLLSGGLSGS